MPSGGEQENEAEQEGQACKLISNIFMWDMNPECLFNLTIFKRESVII